MIHLLWAIHNHQPVGNFDFIFERAFNQAYKPFLDVLGAHPKVRVSMHYTGILLDWLEKSRPEYLAAIRTLVERGQIEMLGGGFYEPILPVISDSHKVGQLKKLSATVKRLFGTAPRGLWLAERVWEPTLVKPISEAGLEYVLLDGSHFKMVGKTEDDMDGYFLSEDQGHTLRMFPIHDVIRDYIPFRPVEEVVDALIKLDSGPDVQVVFGDDGEKFGDWPGTYGHVYEHRWLHRFFEAVESRPDHIRIQPLESGLKPSKNLGLVYLPPASYQEMMVWAQDSRDIVLFRKAQKAMEKDAEPGARKFLRGTFWRNFFNKYPESNRMHKQGIRLSRDLAAAGDLPAADREKALDHIMQSQCNCGYWHGVFGGLYLPHLRFGLYRNLIAAQKVVDRALFGSAAEPAPGSRGGPAAAAPAPVWEVQDWDCDGKPEYTLNSPEAYLSLTHKGELDQFWLKATGINLADTLTRRHEAYHDLLGGGAEGGTKLENSLGEKEANLRSHLIYDRRTRHSLSDVFLAPETPFQEYATQAWNPAYRFEAREVALERRPGETAVRFIGEARPASPGGALRVEKTVILEKGSANLRVEWTFKAGSAPAEFRFVNESLFCLLAGNAHDRYVEWDGRNDSGHGNDSGRGDLGRDILASRGEMPGTAKVALTDEWLKLRCEVRSSGAVGAWRDALETVSQSEGGYERVYQGTVVMPVWDIRLAAGGEAKASLSIQIREGG